MKKTIITLMFAVAAMATFAQVKTDTTKVNPVEKPKPEFKFDINVPVGVVLTFDEFKLVSKSPEEWKGLEWSKEATGEQIQLTKAAADEARKKLLTQLNGIVAQEQKNYHDI